MNPFIEKNMEKLSKFMMKLIDVIDPPIDYFAHLKEVKPKEKLAFVKQNTMNTLHALLLKTIDLFVCYSNDSKLLASTIIHSSSH